MTDGGNVVDEFDCDDPKGKADKYIYLDNSERTWLNWTCRFIYNILKTIHTFVWFYFLPFSIIYLSYSVPYGMIEAADAADADVVDPAAA